MQTPGIGFFLTNNCSRRLLYCSCTVDVNNITSQYIPAFCIVLHAFNNCNNSKKLIFLLYSEHTTKEKNVHHFIYLLVIAHWCIGLQTTWDVGIILQRCNYFFKVLCSIFIRFYNFLSFCSSFPDILHCYCSFRIQMKSFPINQIYVEHLVEIILLRLFTFLTNSLSITQCLLAYSLIRSFT